MSDLPSNSVEILNKGTIIKEGDTNFIFLVKLVDAYGNPVDLTSASSIMVYFSNASNVLLLEKQATQALSEGDGVISFSFDEEDATGNGTINLQFNVTYNSGKIEKFPASDFTKIQITPSLDNLENVELSTYTIQQVIDQLTNSFSTSLNNVQDQLTNQQSTYETNLNSQFDTHKTEVQNDVATIDERVTNLNKIYVSSSPPSDVSATLWVDTTVE